MRKSGRRLTAIFSAFAISLLMCGTGAVATALTLTLPQLVQRLGPPGPRLDPLERAALGTYLLLNAADLDRPAGDPAVTLDLVVVAGETAGSVVSQLQAEGVVENGRLLSLYLRYRGLDVGIEAGRYFLSGGMTPRMIAELLQTAEPRAAVITVIEGWRREQIAPELAREGLTFDPQDFLEATEMPPASLPLTFELPAASSLEGFLFPDTYRLDPETTVEDLVSSMLENFDRQVTPALRARFRRQGLSLYEAVSLASIVEREAVLPVERPLIASVYDNRLEAGMKLDADPTVQFALGQQPDGEWWKAPLSLRDLEFDSPYNTYLYAGFPPGPISNPGLASLRAVAFPADSTFLYFRAACDGSGRHVFAETFEEHIANSCP